MIAGRYGNVYPQFAKKINFISGVKIVLGGPGMLVLGVVLPRIRSQMQSLVCTRQMGVSLH